jgi:hypothetical protein
MNARVVQYAWWPTESLSFNYFDDADRSLRDEKRQNLIRKEAEIFLTGVGLSTKSKIKLTDLGQDLRRKLNE